MTTKKRRLLIALFVVFFVATAYVFLNQRSPVLIRLGDGPAAFEDDAAYDILNPFRDRGPEKPAIEILRMVKDGHCADVARTLEPGRQDYSCEEDTKLRLLSWRLRAREDNAHGNTILYYEVQRDFGPDGIKWGDPYWFRVQKTPQGRWKVISLERWF
jgi:hypothetical protein